MSSDSPAVSIGVDFGTSNTVVALATEEGRVETVRFAHGEATQSVYASALCFWQEPSRRGLPPSVEGGPWAIERLIEHVENSVEARTNVRLIREVRIIGERQ